MRSQLARPKYRSMLSEVAGIFARWSSIGSSAGNEPTYLDVSVVDGRATQHVRIESAYAIAKYSDGCSGDGGGGGDRYDSPLALDAGGTSPLKSSFGAGAGVVHYVIPLDNSSTAADGDGRYDNPLGSDTSAASLYAEMDV